MTSNLGSLLVGLSVKWSKTQLRVVSKKILRRLTNASFHLLEAKIGETKSKGRDALSSPWTAKFRMSVIKEYLCLLLKRKN